MAREAQLAAEDKAKKENNFQSNIFGGVLKNRCESNFDCKRPQVCCDVGFKKFCCSNRLRVVDGIPVEGYESGLLKMPLPNDNYNSRWGFLYFGKCSVGIETVGIFRSVRKYIGVDDSKGRMVVVMQS